MAAETFGTQVCHVYRESHGLPPENFVTRKIPRAAARIAHGLEDALVLGSLSSRRDWGHARDYVRAMC